MFNNGGEGGESENEEDYEDCNQISHEGYRVEDGDGAPYAQSDEQQDIEGDREVEMLKRRLERQDYMRVKRKMRPNISTEWINKLKEILRILSNGGLSNSNSRGNAPSPPQQ